MTLQRARFIVLDVLSIKEFFNIVDSISFSVILSEVSNYIVTWWGVVVRNKCFSTDSGRERSFDKLTSVVYIDLTVLQLG
jgi:hypothetical protein